MKSKLLLAALLGLAFTASASAATRTYFERESFDEGYAGSNDTRATAEYVGTLWGGNTILINGSHTTLSRGTTSADYYRIVLGIDTLLTASIQGYKPNNSTTVATTFSLLSSTGSLIRSGASLSEDVSKGTYYVRVANSTKSFNYVISAAAAATAVPEADMASLAVLGFGAAGFMARRRKRA
ncbi:PEP-CTERM sorting domain-containing protein [Derxia gummosa]|uniref:PEP-CTERM sorting domain-containing protein n=1 Tax=Derxia gummosa DSM 723 TaxID=1121388 RepID=A0A8B6X692_9BURK|nr:PEP-CTERM sorting domain-containing protein [Derxia gummosa]